MSAKVIVIEKDESRRQQLRAVFDFLESEQTVVVDCVSWKAEIDEPSEILVVFIGGCENNGHIEDILNTLRALEEDIPVVLMQQDGVEHGMDSEAAVGVMEQISFPPKYDELTSALKKARIYRESHREQTKQRAVTLFRSLVGNSRAIRHVRKLIEQVAGSNANVLILGESGTGKEVVARNLHYNSVRRDKPFVPINCGAIPGDLLESELFGHEKGAFTGAITARQGRFEMAEGGTLFLDEIGDMSLNMQVKLLRVLQERTFERVGSNKSIQADVRIIAATHRDLEDRIQTGEFREDLFYRLNVFPIEMPPLRARTSDIPLLVNDLITRFENENRGSVRLTPAAIVSLCQYHWPGNVRELANLIERLVILYPYGVVDLTDLPEKFRIQGLQESDIADMNAKAVNEIADDGIGGRYHEARLPQEGFDLKEHLNNLEYSFIKQALDEANGVVAHAAKRLNMRRTTLVEKLRKYGLQRNDEASNF